ncbi:hypothetical protein [Streptomyces sp. NPDC002785]|uniref:hypothetical protein n=1 Tax=Streptomyces sp. NPDC002785 TaxID=3154543 RepID=UPI003322DE2E
MAQTKFDKQVEKEAESLMFGIGRVLAGRDPDGVRRTDATFWRSGTRVLPKVEGRIRRRSYKAGWRRLSFRLALGAGVAEAGYPGHPGPRRHRVRDVLHRAGCRVKPPSMTNQEITPPGQST